MLLLIINGKGCVCQMLPRNDYLMTPVERVLLDFLLDTSAAFSRHADARSTLTSLEQEIRSSLHRTLKKLPVVTTTTEIAQPTLGCDA